MAEIKPTTSPTQGTSSVVEKPTTGQKSAAEPPKNDSNSPVQAPLDPKAAQKLDEINRSMLLGIFKIKDENGDGKINWDEAKGKISKALFDLIDGLMRVAGTKNGEISQEELAKAKEILLWFTENVLCITNGTDEDKVKAAFPYYKDAMAFEDVDKKEIEERQNKLSAENVNNNTISTFTIDHKNIPGIEVSGVKIYPAVVDMARNYGINDMDKTLNDREKEFMLKRIAALDIISKFSSDLQEKDPIGINKQNQIPVPKGGFGGFWGKGVEDSRTNSSVNSNGGLAPKQRLEQAKEAKKKYLELTGKLDEADKKLKPYVDVSQKENIIYKGYEFTAPKLVEPITDQAKQARNAYFDIYLEYDKQQKAMIVLFASVADDASADQKIRNEARIELGRYDETINDAQTSNYIKAKAHLAKFMQAAQLQQYVISAAMSGQIDPGRIGDISKTIKQATDDGKKSLAEAKKLLEGIKASSLTGLIDNKEKSEFYTQLALVYIFGDNKEKAKEALDEALKLDSNNESAKKLLEGLKAAGNSAKDADLVNSAIGAMRKIKNASGEQRKKEMHAAKLIIEKMDSVAYKAFQAKLKNNHPLKSKTKDEALKILGG